MFVAQAAFHYLSDKGLIAGHFGIPFAGRMTAAGHDAIKEAESIPDKASPALAAPIRRGGHREQTGKLAGGTRCRGSLHHLSYEACAPHTSSCDFPSADDDPWYDIAWLG
jgi:hypothetical protein